MDKEKWYDPYLDEMSEWDLLDDLEADGDDTLLSHIDDLGSTSGQIYNPPSDEWPAIINSTNHTLTIQEISHSDFCVEWKCLMRTTDAVWSESFSISSPLPLPVERCFTLESVAFPCAAFPGDPPTYLDVLTRITNLEGLADELCFVTLQILEGRYNGAYTRTGPGYKEETGY